jgi:hypothetical protein
MSELKIRNKYDKMTPQELREVAARFQGLSDEAMGTLNKVAEIFIKKYTPRCRELPNVCRNR